jgi:hypothetical protein
MARRNVTRNDKQRGDATQLSLFDALAVEERQEPLSESEPEPKQEEMVTDPHGNLLPAVVFQASAGWADGDTSPEALERLALCLLGEITICYYGPPLSLYEEKYRWRAEYGHSMTGRERYYYRCVATGIIGTIVWGAYIYEKCLMDLTRQRNVYDNEEEDL